MAKCMLNKVLALRSRVPLRRVNATLCQMQIQIRSITILGSVLRMRESLPSHKEQIRACRTLILGQFLGVSH